MRNRIIVWSVVALIVVGALAAPYFQPEAEPPKVISATPRKPRPAAPAVPTEAAAPATGENQSPAAQAPAAEATMTEPGAPETSAPPAATEPQDLPAPAKRFETDLTTPPAEIPPADMIETVPSAADDAPPLILGGPAANSDTGSSPMAEPAAGTQVTTEPAPPRVAETSVSPEATAPPAVQTPPDSLRRLAPIAPGTIPSATMGKIRRYAEHVISQHDNDGDGQLSGTEWQQLSADYRLSDLDRDGVLTTSELAARIAVYSRRRAIRLMPDRGPVEQAGTLDMVAAENNGTGSNLSAAERELARRQAARRFTVDESRLPQGLPKWFSEADADGDGQVSIAELSARWSPSQLTQFLAFDLNNDGLITADECLRADRHRQEQSAAAASRAAAEALPPLSSAVE